MAEDAVKPGTAVAFLWALCICGVGSKRSSESQLTVASTHLAAYAQRVTALRWAISMTCLACMHRELVCSA